MTHFSDEAVKIAQKAQAAATLEPMTSFDQENKLEATVASELYEEFVQAQLVKESWRFAMMQTELDHLAAVPKARFSDAWQLPTVPAVLKIKAVTVNDSPIIFDRFNDKIYADYDENNTLVLDHVYRVSEEFWPPDFKMFVILSLGSLFAAAITRNGDLIEGLENKANEFFVSAIKNHSQGRTAQKVNTGRIVRRRR